MNRRVAAVTLLAILALTGPARPADDPPRRPDDPARARRRTPVVEVFERCRNSVVNISTTRIVRMRSLGFGSFLDDVFDFGRPRPVDRRVHSVGSGVIVHESGYVVTNAHVVSQASDIGVTLADGRALPASVVAVDAEHDLAVLKVDAPQPLAAQKLGRSDDLMIGETVIAVGNPLGLQHTVTAGIISALDRELEFGADVVYRGLIQTDAPINPGNSGGPLLNIDGELIGINTAIRGDAQNIGFAIPVDRLWELVPAMLDIERRARVRFGARVVGPDAQVVAVRPDSPAEAAGIRPGDRVVQLGSHALRDAIDYHVHLLEQEPGQDVRLAVQRGGRRLELKVPLEIVPPPDGRRLAAELLGMDLAEMPPEVQRRYDLPAHVRLVVEAVRAGGPAEYAGIRPGDMILRVDRYAVESLADLGLVLERVSGGQRVPVEGFRLRADPPFLWTAVLRAEGRGRGAAG